MDTEEEGLWSGQHRSRASVENIGRVPIFQEGCYTYGERPTYLVTTPVARSNEAVAILRSIQRAGRCEIGSHVHPWNSPPISGHAVDEPGSFLCNLAPQIQRVKIVGLTNLIVEQFGKRPITFRAGRYGMGIDGINILRDLGYRVDSSVIPYSSYAKSKGPNYADATCDAYSPGASNILERGTDTSLIEVPLTVGFTHCHFSFAHKARSVAERFPRRFRAVGILDRTGIATKRKLSPEQTTLREMKRLADAVRRRGNPSLVLMFHSSSLKPTCSPYVQAENEL